MRSGNLRCVSGNEVVIAYYDLVTPGVWKYNGVFSRYLEPKSWLGISQMDLPSMFPIPKYQVEIDWHEKEALAPVLPQG
jgi:hypothetical protein